MDYGWMVERRERRDGETRMCGREREGKGGRVYIERKRERDRRRGAFMHINAYKRRDEMSTNQSLGVT